MVFAPAGNSKPKIITAKNPSVPEGRTVNNLRFQPEEVLHRKAKTPEGFPQLVKRCIFHPTLSHVPRVKPEVHPQKKLFYDAPSDSLYN